MKWERVMGYGCMMMIEYVWSCGLVVMMERDRLRKLRWEGREMREVTEKRGRAGGSCRVAEGVGYWLACTDFFIIS